VISDSALAQRSCPETEEGARQVQQQIPPLRCGMTTKGQTTAKARTDNGKSKNRQRQEKLSALVVGLILRSLYQAGWV
jgi:hypothetical protein